MHVYAYICTHVHIHAYKQVLKHTNGPTEAHRANGVYFYLRPGSSFGFSRSPRVNVSLHDQEAEDQQHRLSWILDGQHGGYRLGSLDGLNQSHGARYEKLILFSNGQPPRADKAVLSVPLQCWQARGAVILTLLTVVERVLAIDGEAPLVEFAHMATRLFHTLALWSRGRVTEGSDTLQC